VGGVELAVAAGEVGDVLGAVVAEETAVVELDG